MVLAVGVCLYNLPRLLFGTPQFDAIEVHYSAQRYLADELHVGRLPFWTPYIFSGFPFLADLQVAAWYPLNWPFYLAGITPASIHYELLLHTLIACTGVYALGLRLIGRPAPAVAAALFYGCSGWFAAHSQHLGMVATAAWLPWLLVLLEALARRVSVPRLALAGLLGAAVALPGHFQIALYAFTGVGVWAAAEATARRSWTTAARFALGLGSLGLWGALLAGVMILPALELVGQSIRAQLQARAVDLGYFHPGSLLTLVNPDYYGLLSGHYAGPGDSTQHYFYAGLLLVPLALLGARDRRILRTAAFLGLPFLWYAAGPAAGLFRVVARLPGFSSVELPMHGWFLPALGLALLGGAGLGAVEARFGQLASFVALALLLVDLVTVNQVLNPLAYGRTGFDEVYGDSLRAFQTQVDSVHPTRVYGPPLTSIGYRNHPLQSRVETTYGYNPLELAAYASYVDAAEQKPRLLAGLAASHSLEPDGHLVAMPASLPLVSFAEDAELDASATLSVVGRGQDFVTFRYVSNTMNLVRVAIPAFPGWRATTGTSELEVRTVDGAFVGVVVPPGEAEVRVFYTPRFFWLGGAISAMALVAALVALFAKRAAQFVEARDHGVQA